jgi:hypothetical protein
MMDYTIDWNHRQMPCLCEVVGRQALEGRWDGFGTGATVVEHPGPRPFDQRHHPHYNLRCAKSGYAGLLGAEGTKRAGPLHDVPGGTQDVGDLLAFALASSAN